MRTSKTPASGTERSRKRRVGLLKRIKEGVNAQTVKTAVIIVYFTIDFAQDGLIDGSPIMRWLTG